jgi:hypothetical protein
MNQEISISIEDESELIKIALDDFLAQQVAFKKMIQANGEKATHIIAPNEKEIQPTKLAASSAAKQ